ncbi:TonB-dependent receptor plug domain-containing protein [Steroidobacter sp.]|uniref:TonB-dependent receptor plug domain-containing protein n=1 Tax=Steroidobacter sp. TaxID=1978227 RepID=UPI001A52C78F|nr:TonB-dependent receptor [Steroidobacter sp.]MBL8269279.1 TonB-dependent receptor [Steroidobacter sp.]
MVAVNDVDYSVRVRRHSAVALAVAIACAGSAYGQSAAGQSTTENSETIDVVVVSGSRISTAGFDAPTPTTVLGEVELRQAGRTDIAATLTDLPQFRSTQSASSTNTVTSSGQTPADLRGLGASRTLVLVNNRRYISSDDLQTVPYSLVKRIDVVTGGASAAYGSDAVAGVVNIILDDNREGVEVGVQRGRSTHGDAEKTLVEASFGTKLFDDRAHLLVGADYLKDDGIIPGTRRPRIGEANFFPGTDGLLYPTANLHEARRSEGGLINTGVLTGQTFDTDGSLRPFQYGVRRAGSPNLMIGGEGYNIDQFRSVVAPIERANVMGRFSLNVTDNVKVWAELIYNNVKDERVYFPDLAITQLTFSYDNPFLNLTPAQRALVQGAGETTFTMGRAVTDVALASYKYDREAVQATIGFDGEFADGKWRYNGYYGRGKQEQDMKLLNLALAENFFNAIDAVTGPGGSPVCRIALTDPTTACRPLNLFGSGRASQAAVDYVTADWHAIDETWLDTAGIILSGEPFELWNQPVSFATGIEYRKEQFRSTYDANSLAGNFATINGENISKIGNDVTEGFVEVAIPLLADKPLVQSLNFNGAARISDYSTSGSIWSWKLGGTWHLVNDFKLRATRSRDIRAPNLTELFSSPSTFFTNVQDVSQTPASTTQVTLFTGGSTALDPEIADTLTVGAVYSPSFVPGLEVSLDYYHIKIEDVITTLTAQQIVNSCYQQGNQSACNQITRTGGVITEINATYINIAEFVNKGFDLEASYRFDVGPGQVTVRGLANYVDTLAVDNGIITIEGAGYLGSQATFLVPKWRGSVTLAYESEFIGGDLRARYLDGGGYAPSNVLSGVGNNNIASRTYVDLGLRTYIPLGESKLTVYGSVQNVFDKEPALAALNSPYFDIVGRYFTLGVRANF